MSLFRDWRTMPHEPREAVELALAICEQDIYPRMGEGYAPDPKRLDFVLGLCANAQTALEQGTAIDQRLAQEIDRLARDLAQWQTAQRLNVKTSFKEKAYRRVNPEQAVRLHNWRLTVQLEQPESSGLTYRGAAVSVIGESAQGKLLTASIEAVQMMRFPKTKFYEKFPRRQSEQAPSRVQYYHYRRSLAQPNVLLRDVQGNKFMLAMWNRLVADAPPKLEEQSSVDSIVQRGFAVYGYPLDEWTVEPRGRDLLVRGIAFRERFEEVALIVTKQANRTLEDTAGQKYELLHANKAWLAAQPPETQAALAPPPHTLPHLSNLPYEYGTFPSPALPELPSRESEPTLPRVRFGSSEETYELSPERSRSQSPKRK